MDDPAAGEFEPGQDQSTATVKPALWKSWAFKAVRCQKQLNTDQMPASVQSWAILAGICSAALVAVVYIYGWHTSGASLLMLSPACLYVAVCLAQVVWIAASGPTPTAHRLRMLAATLQIYYFVFPIFQPRDKVCSSGPINEPISSSFYPDCDCVAEALPENHCAPNRTGNGHAPHQ